ncbi:hypothetical protein Tco_0032573 [Tanacetum coccineum]
MNNFVVVRSPSPHNGIIGRPGVRMLQPVPLIAHGMLKLPVEGGVITQKSSKMVPLECAMVSGPEGNPLVTKQIVEERFKVVINLEYPEQTIMIGTTLTEEGHSKLCDLLQGCSPVRQKKRRQAADRNQAIQEEVGKLVEAGIMNKIVHYRSGCRNPVRRDVLRIQSRYKGVESMSRQGRRCFKSPIPKMLKGRTKVKQKARKPEQREGESFMTVILMSVLVSPDEGEKMGRRRRKREKNVRGRKKRLAEQEGEKMYEGRKVGKRRKKRRMGKGG